MDNSELAFCAQTAVALLLCAMNFWYHLKLCKRDNQYAQAKREKAFIIDVLRAKLKAEDSRLSGDDMKDVVSGEGMLGKFDRGLADV